MWVCSYCKGQPTSVSLYYPRTEYDQDARTAGMKMTERQRRNIPERIYSSCPFCKGRGFAKLPVMPRDVRLLYRAALHHDKRHASDTSVRVEVKATERACLDFQKLHAMRDLWRAMANDLKRRMTEKGQMPEDLLEVFEQVEEFEKAHTCSFEKGRSEG